MKTADDVANWIVSEGVAPTAAAGCAAYDGAHWTMETGGARSTYFDLASLTKPMTATTIAMTGMARGAPLSTYLPELSDTLSAGFTIEQLLAHRSGLVATFPAFEPLTRSDSFDRSSAMKRLANALAANLTLSNEPIAPVYSDVGYILAGEALARWTGLVDAGAAIEEWVAKRLGVKDALGTARYFESIGLDIIGSSAPTEHVDWRGGVVRGRVHDENAWALGGLVGCGHAGMFGTVSAVLHFGCAFLDSLLKRASPLGSHSFEWLVSERPGGTLRAGFDGKSATASSAGEHMSASTFGHLGFTGTSLWIDPQAQIVVTLLTNRVCPTRDNLKIRSGRPLAHDALFLRAANLRSSEPAP